MKKNGTHVRPSCISAESSNVFTGKCLWWRLFLTKDANQEFISAISLKRDSNTEVFPCELFTVNFKLPEKFSVRYLCKTFSDKVAGFQSIHFDFIGNNVRKYTV